MARHPRMRPRAASAGRMTAAFTAGAASVIATVLLAALVTEHLISTRTAEGASIETPLVAPPSARQGTMVNRRNKSDPLSPPATNAAPRQVTTVEVVGIREAAIVYRDRHGNVLFRTDPVSNVTLIAKDVDLPQITIRDAAGSAIEHMPIKNVDPPSLAPGCESAFGAAVDPALGRIVSRCFAAAEAPVRRTAY